MSELKVVLCWHMHQPQYRDAISGDYLLPWTYLHGIKDYCDMATILAEVPEARAVFNFTPVLLDQLEDYAYNLRQHLTIGARLRDPLLASLAAPEPGDGTTNRQLELIRQCLNANETHQIDRFPSYRSLVHAGRFLLQHRDILRYVEHSFFSDLVTWYHLVWLGETVRKSNPRVKKLIDQGQGYNHQDRLDLLGVIGDLLQDIIPAYRRLAEHGQAELAMSPYAHPLLPAFTDRADSPLASLYNGNGERARWHLARGRERFQHHFHRKPVGCWPPEGGISLPTVHLLDEYGFSWCASSDVVLHQSLPDHANPQAIYRPEHGQLCCFFRNTELSDLIGFEYARWRSHLAVRDLVHRLERIYSHLPEDAIAIVTILMDGENAWEHYAENGYSFLHGLYQALSAHHHIDLTTFADALDSSVPIHPLAQLTPGSWVYGNFDKWHNNEAKRHAWQLLESARCAVSGVLSDLDSDCQQKVLEQLAVCEGSDWFWWPGEDSSLPVLQFDALFRHHLSSLYHLAGLSPPLELEQPLTESPTGSGDAQVMIRQTPPKR